MKKKCKKSVIIGVILISIVCIALSRWCVSALIAIATDKIMAVSDSGLGIGDGFIVKADKGTYTCFVKKVETKPNRTIEVILRSHNIDHKPSLQIIDTQFRAYDKKGNELTLCHTSEQPPILGINEWTDYKIRFNTTSISEYIRLEYTPLGETKAYNNWILTHWSVQNIPYKLFKFL